LCSQSLKNIKDDVFNANIFFVSLTNVLGALVNKTLKIDIGFMLRLVLCLYHKHAFKALYAVNLKKLGMLAFGRRTP